MGKREFNKINTAAAKFAAAAGIDLDELMKEVDADSLYSADENAMEGQAVMNFFVYRVKPILEGKKPGESESRFKSRQDEWERAFNEWRIRVCDSCKQEFAYAFAYEGVKYCSLFCLDEALKDIGLRVTRGRDLRQRWGYQYAPAIVPSSAFAALKEIHQDDAGVAFSA